MKIVVVSDTHGDFAQLKRVAMIENGSDLFLHAGDSRAFSLNEISPFATVKGNCDYNLLSCKSEYWALTPYGKLYMRHYPLFGDDVRELKEKNIRIFIHGHTHIKEFKKIDGIYILCPGSLTRPRDDYASYMVLNVSKEAIDVEFKAI